MPKRHVNSNVLTKQYAALVSANNNSSASSSKNQQTVNELIQKSRARSRAMEIAATVANMASDPHTAAELSAYIAQDQIDQTAKLYHSSLSSYLANPIEADQPVQPAVPSRRGRRNFAGPPPPPTWLRQERTNFVPVPGSRNKKKIDQYLAMSRFRSQPEFQQFREDRSCLRKNLPGLPLSTLPELLPREGSLQHWCLIRLARDWEFNIHYLQYYLPSLEPSMKMALISYLGLYSTNGVGPQGLELLFDSRLAKMYEQEEDGQLDMDTSAFNCNSGTYNDFIEDEDNELSNGSEVEDMNDRITSLDLSFQIDDSNLSLAFFSKFITPKVQASLADSWQQHFASSNRIFPFLSALSLAYPSTSSPTKLWSTLLSMVKSHPTFVALSLASWPIPPELFYSTPDRQAQVFPSRPQNSTLGTLSKTAICLKWLDLSYCTWVDEQVIASCEWSSGWRNLRTLVLHGIEHDVCEKIRKVILEARGPNSEVNIVY
ncbi:hypothetical protein V1511DRAFT_494714 [Dipodascopsis uninucleata]